jgi:hypothetical protein
MTLHLVPEFQFGTHTGDVCAFQKGLEVIDFKRSYPNRRTFLASSAKLLLIILTAATAALASTPSLDRISCVNKTYSSAGIDTCRAFLTGTTSTHLYIALSSNNPAVAVPSGITVSLYAASKGFTATAVNVNTPQTAIITATLNGISKSFKISLAPAASGAAMSVNATSISFGSAVLNSPVAQSVTVTSTGTASLTVNSAAVTGTGFSVSGATFPATLNPGQSLTLQLQFDPKTAGTYSGQLTVASSATTRSIPLSGTGAPHQVELSWSSPATSGNPIAGYNVYRALSGSQSYARLNASVEPATAYTDSAVQSGTAYVYLVKSVSSTGIESSSSNTTAVKIP